MNKEKSEKETLKKVEVEPSKIEILNDMITEEIVKALKQDDRQCIAGVVATAASYGIKPERVNLLFLYSEYTPKQVEWKNITNHEIEMELYLESTNLWTLEDEEARVTMRSNYSWEQEIKYGTLLYDRNGNVEKLRKKLLEEGTNDKNYWHDMCEFTPPIQYKKRAKN